MRLPRFRRPAEARPPDQRVEKLASRLRTAARRARESGPGRRCERWLGGLWSAVRGRDYESGKCISYREVVSAIQDIRRRRLLFSILYASVLAGTLTVLKLQGVRSDESASRILRTVFSAAPVVFALHIKFLVAKSKAYLSDAEPEIRAALSQPLSASKSLFDATLVFLLWNPVMEIRSLEHLRDVVLELIR